MVKTPPSIVFCVSSDSPEIPEDMWVRIPPRVKFGWLNFGHVAVNCAVVCNTLCLSFWCLKLRWLSLNCLYKTCLRLWPEICQPCSQEHRNHHTDSDNQNYEGPSENAIAIQKNNEQADSHQQFNLQKWIPFDVTVFLASIDHTRSRTWVVAATTRRPNH